LNNQIELVTGKIQKVYSLDPEGVKVNTIEEIEGGKNYVVVANNDPLIRIRYNTKAIQTVHDGPMGLAGFTMKNEHMSHIRHVSKRYPKQPSFKNQTSFQEATQPPAKPQPEPQSRKASVKRQPSAKKEVESARQSAVSRGRTAASEGVGTSPEPFEEPHLDHHDNEKEEVYGEQDIKELTSRDKIARTPSAKPKTPGPRSAAASPEPIASSIGSPKQARSAVMSPQSQARSALVSPQSQARAAVDPRSGLTSAKSTKTNADNESEAHDTDLDESRVVSPEPLPPKTPQSKRASNEALKVGATETIVNSTSSRKQSQSEAKSKSGTKSNVASKPDLAREGSEPALTKSVKGSKEALTKSQKSSRENLKTPKTPKTPA
jgi:hypothetical protein